MFRRENLSVSLRVALVAALLLALISAIPTLASGSVIYVNWDASGANDGTSWADAFTDLQSALAAASSGDEIYVAAGTYKPTLGTDRTISFTLKDGVAVYGGFVGTETSLPERDFLAYVTILSADIGIEGDTSDNSYHVVIGSNTDNSAVLDGFTITGGNANVSPFDKGGGMYNLHGSPLLMNLIFTDNYARFGGGMNNESLTPLESSTPTLLNVNFIHNSAVEGGGMQNMSYSSPTLENVQFWDNTALRAGGGMVNMYQNNVIMLTGEFSGNVAGTGGGLANVYSDPILDKVTFSNNSAEWGGGISNGGSSPSITNATFYGNSATTYGGAISNESNSHTTLFSVTISGNSAGTYGGGIYDDSNGTTVHNSILYGNSGGAIYNAAGSAVVNYSIIEGGYPGIGNIDADPLLGPLQENNGTSNGSPQIMPLLPGSPAIDAGDDANCMEIDQRFLTRPQGNHCDMGAFEFELPATPTPTDTETPTDTPTSTPTDTRMPTATSTRTPTIIYTPTVTRTRTPTRTPGTPTSTRTSTATLTPIPTFTPPFTPTFIPTATRTATRTPSSTWAPTETHTPTSSSTPTFTSTLTPTNTSTWTPTSTLIFQPYVNFPVGSGKAVGIGDFNSDGRADVALTTSTQLMVFLQNQDGSLAGAVAYSAGSRPEALAVGDVNSDNRADIVVANYNSSTISVFLQQANGSLAARVTYPTSSGPDAVAIGDLNNDGLVDIAVSHWTAPNVGVFIQAGDGSIRPMITYPSPQAGYDDIAIADINHDGKNDLIKTNGQGQNPNLSIYRQETNGTLASAVAYSVTNCTSSCLSRGLGTGDVTGDGLTDIVISYGGNRPNSKIAVFAQSSDGSLATPVAYAAYDIPIPVEVADVNRDGRADVVVAHSAWNSLSIFTQREDQTLNDYLRFTLPYGSYESQGLAVGDLNQDGLVDVAIADSNNGLVLLYQTLVAPTPTFTPTQPPTPVMYTISGNTGVGSVRLYYSRSGAFVTSDSDGNYSLTVPSGWSGTITPSLRGYRFTPADRTYSDVQSNLSGQDFTAEQFFMISGNVGADGVILSYAENGTLQTVTTYPDGSYMFEVPKYWSGTVTPSKPGFTFSPAARTYTNIVTDQLNQNYQMSLLTISGNVGLSDTTLYYLDFASGNTNTVISDQVGNYSILVPYLWNGSVTPFKPGYVFNPPYKFYSGVQTDFHDQNYTPHIARVISGNVGVGQASVSYFDDTYKSIATDDSGNYSVLVSDYWSGTITPSKSNYAFIPTSRSYIDVQEDLSDQNYAAIPLYTISGNVRHAGVILNYEEDGAAKTAVSNSSGNYSFKVKAGWSGTVTPAKPGVIFEPANRSYADVQSNQTVQNYKASVPVTTLADSGPGSLRQAVENAVYGDVISFHPDLTGQTITLASTISINTAVTIDGSGLNPRVAISGNDTVKIFGVDPRFDPNGPRDVRFHSLILQNGRGSMGIGGGNIVIDDVLFLNNSAYDGGAISTCCYNTTIRIIRSEFRSNSAERYGGAIAIQLGSLTVQDSTFIDNAAGSVGGAISIEREGPHTLEDNTFVNNDALSGGAIRFESIESPVIVRRNLFSGNQASLNGGAIFEMLAYSTASFTIENNTFYANQANDKGGAISLSDTATFRNNTFSENRALNYGGSLSLGYAGHGYLYNNILANSPSGGECYLGTNAWAVGNNNLIEDGSANCAAMLTGDPLLGPLANNGGTNMTMELLLGSPVIDVGNNANCPSTDQRGVTRPQGDHCDIGAFEYVFPQIPTPTGTATDTPTYTPTPTDSPTNTPTFTPTPTILTLVLQPNGTTGLDSYIYNGSKNANFGAAVDMGVGENNNAINRYARSLIKFDLSTIPANATINSATLSLWTSVDLSSNDRTIRVYRLKTAFNETQATWSLAATGNSWQIAGASGANDRETSAIGSVTILNNEALNLEKQIVLAPDRIQELVNGTFVNRGFIIVADTELNDRFNYMSSDSTIASQRPKLVIQYTVASASPTETATMTPSPTLTPTTTEVSATSTFTSTATDTATATPTSTITRTVTPTRTATRTRTPSFTPTRTPTRTPSLTPTFTPTLTPSLTPTFTATDTPTLTSTATYTNTPTDTSVLYVKWNATGENNGTSWANAYTDLQSALFAATTGQEIWVAAGTYKPTSGADRTVSFLLKNGVAVYGGFAGTETSLSQRDYQTNVTTLSGDIGTAGDNSDNSYHVVIGSNTNDTAVLDGFTVTGGNANVSPSDKGGGMYNFHGSPSLTNLIITGNYATFGGGMNNESLTLSESSNPNLSNVSFINNTAVEGGGMRNMNYSSPTLDNVKFQNNTVLRAGGGMVNMYQNNVKMLNVEFSGNTAGTGGGLANAGSNPILENVTFRNNSAEWGGAISNGYSSPTITNATFHGNSATTYGGAISTEGNSNPTLTNVTISGNSAVTYGGGIYNDYNGGSIRNSIIYGNTGGTIYNSSGNAVVSYSIVEGGYAGTGNLDIDPLLLSLQDNGGFTETMAILSGSPAIDSGDDANCPDADQRGIARPQGDGCDIGAFEYESLVTPPPMTIVIPTSTGTPTYTPTFIPTITLTITATPTVTHTPVTPTLTRTSTLSPTSVPTDTPTFTPTLTATATETATSTPSVTLTPTGTHTPTSTVPEFVTLNLNSVAGNDGWILESAETSNLGGTFNATLSTIDIGDDKSNKQSIGILHFDTSSLPDNAVITSVTLQVQKQDITGTDPFTTHGSLVLDVQKPYFGTTAGLLTSDFSAAAGGTAVSTFDPTPVNNWYSAILDNEGYVYIDLTGTTQFRLRFTLDDNNDRGVDIVKFFSGEVTAANRPQLIIQYYIP